ncbi:efflux RND transporter periplasmic adaptor subunit [Xanthobacter flavus]|uniref:efflux RND transporter periplasmic adaptor subunit n=1 Tax=Xanthobacter flavus TaxID=281 RepID=UPI001D8AE9D7|nr:efflux RND transporter periplasmic adaptor subunit [Xanthobacter flavus]MBP2148146.1 RND family efflux transporter MFP subunit [Xanthobacter flavus]
MSASVRPALRPARSAASRLAVSAFAAGALAAGALAAPPAVAADPAKAAEAARAAALSVTVVKPRPDTLTDTLLVTGSIKPREEIEVGPEIEGYRLMEILVEAGDRVQKGQVLARLSRDVLETQLAQNTASAAKARAAIAQQQAALDQAIAQETEANSAVERTRQLSKTGTSSQEQLEQRERAAKVATAQVAAARETLIAAQAEAVFVKAQRDELDVKLKRTDVRAPASGLVLSREAKLGAIALSTRAAPLFRIAEDGAMDLDADVPEGAMPRMKDGLSVQVVPAGFDEPIGGKVRLVSAEVDRASRLGKVKIALPDDPRLKSGAYGRAVIALGEVKGLSLPQSAVMFDAEGAYVLTVTDGIVGIQRVTPGLKKDGRILVTEGLSADADVVARAGSFLRDGDRVTPARAPLSLGEAR